VESTTPVQVFVNGTLVLSVPGRPDAGAVDAALPGVNGRVPVLIRTQRPADDEWRIWRLAVLWRDPGGSWTAFVWYHPAPAGG